LENYSKYPVIISTETSGNWVGNSL